MKTFGAYAAYYDLFYSDKDYSAEADFVYRLLQKHCAGARSVLDLGCGTAAHAVALGKLGLQVHGVDQSVEMIVRARDRTSMLAPEEAERIEVSVGDLRHLRLDRKFSVVTSLFHVMSYLPNNADLTAAFSTVRDHLEPEGIFIFDFWYGPAVLSDPPAIRVRRAENEAVRVLRVAEPELLANENLVHIHYDIHVSDKRSDSTKQFEETHILRYLFLPELDFMLRSAGLEPVGSYTWLSTAQPSKDTWYACMVARA